MPIFTQLYLYMEKLCHSLPQLFLAILTIYILQNIITFLRGIIITYIYKNSSNMLVLDYCNKLTKLPLPFFHNRETGEILSRYSGPGNAEKKGKGAADSLHCSGIRP